MVNDTTPDIARTPDAFIKRVGCPGQRVGCAIYAEEAVTNTMMGRLSNTLHLKTDSVAMSLSHTILLNRCINQLFFNQEKVDTTTKLFSECMCPNETCTVPDHCPNFPMIRHCAGLIRAHKYALRCNGGTAEAR